MLFLSVVELLRGCHEPPFESNVGIVFNLVVLVEFDFHHFGESPAELQ